MEREIYISKIENKIRANGYGKVYISSDFVEITNKTNIKKALSRLEKTGVIRRILRGIYDYPEYSEFLQEYIEPDMNLVAGAIARNYGWTISPCGDVALNQLGLSTQVPNVWSYISDGPYKKYEYKKVTLEFKHRTNKEITGMSEKTVMIIHALKTLGQDNVTKDTINILQQKTTDSEKEKMLVEAAGATAWIYELIKLVCKG